PCTLVAACSLPCSTARLLTDQPPTVTRPLSLHDALPISVQVAGAREDRAGVAAPHGDDHVAGLHRLGGEDLGARGADVHPGLPQDRKSTRLNSSHVKISYAVFCLRKKRQAGTRL